MGICAYAIDVPEAVTNAFKIKFPLATDVKWGKENKNEYEADFKLNGVKMGANFLSNGTWMATETPIAMMDLPTSVLKTLKEKYTGYTISATFKIEKATGKIAYEAEIKKRTQKQEVILDTDGNILNPNEEF